MTKKIFDRISIIILNLCIFAVFIISPALTCAASHSYYKYEFEKNGIYASEDESGAEERTSICFIGGKSGSIAKFSDEQLDLISHHIIDFLFGDTESFALTMDNVILNGKETDNVEIFGKTAVLHMADVKALMRGALIGDIICALLLILSLVYIIRRRNEIGRVALRYTVIFLTVLLCLIILFLLLTFIGSYDIIVSHPSYFLDEVWTNMHHLLFPFNEEKFENSFFNDTLTQILTLELFMDAVTIVLVSLFTALFLWLGFAFLLRNKNRISANR